MPADYWRHCPDGWRFRCELFPQKIKEKQPAQYKKIQEAMGDIPDSEWKHYTPCCGSRWVPDVHGANAVIEMKVGDVYHAIRAERLPDELVDEIKKVPFRWHEACGRTTPEQIKKAISMWLPKENLYSPTKGKVPGIGRFNIKQWKAEGCPTLRAGGWAALCKAIAVNAEVDMSRIITLCDDIAIANEKDRDVKIAMQMARYLQPTKPISTSNVEC